MKMTFKDRLKSIMQTHSYRVEEAKLEFVCGISRIMAQQGVNNAELARLLDTSPSYATKIMRGDCNFTLDSMVKITHALGGSLHIHVADANARVRWFERFDSSRLTDNDLTQKSVKAVAREKLDLVPHPEESVNETSRLYA